MGLWGNIKKTAKGAVAKAAGVTGHALGGDFGEALAKSGAEKLFDVADSSVSKLGGKKQKHAAATRAASDSMGSTTIALSEPAPMQRGTYLCTVLRDRGLMPQEVYEAAHSTGLMVDACAMLGYGLWARPLARLMYRSQLVMLVLAPFVLAWARHMAFASRRFKHDSFFGRWVHRFGVPVCRTIGRFVSPPHIEPLPVSVEDTAWAQSSVESLTSHPDG